ncbi:hypothetical protein [Photobacterium aquae]|uniref:hypothetical protein n=1 Tax=Photobacterium aquae TaxID=1195763 RepID=UPI0014704267|nr:hypothetical protein [Photobacterium aquae]
MSLVGCQTTQQATFNIEKTNQDNASESFVYAPNDKEEFVFHERAESLRKYGYDSFCADTSTFACYNRLPYDKYLGMKGYFDTEKPVKTHYAGYEFYPVILENGEKYYFVSSTKLGGKYGTTSPIISLKQYHELKSFQSEPLVPSSPIHVISSKLAYGHKSFSLSNGDVIGEKQLNLIRELSARFDNNPTIAELLIDKRINKDEMENQYFISPSIDLLKSDAQLYIGVNDKKEWLRFKVKYYDSSWLFVNSFKVAADDYRWQSPVMKFERDHSSGDVWEWTDVAATKSYINLAKKIANSSKVTIRFYGTQYYSDKLLGEKQKQGIKDILKLHDLMNNNKR